MPRRAGWSLDQPTSQPVTRSLIGFFPAGRVLSVFPSFFGWVLFRVLYLPARSHSSASGWFRNTVPIPENDVSGGRRSWVKNKALTLRVEMTRPAPRKHDPSSVSSVYRISLHLVLETYDAGRVSRRGRQHEPDVLIESNISRFRC